MTRINIGIPPKELTPRHLLAEHREIKRIPNSISKGKYNLKNIPKEFKLGKGHVSFFYDKLLYLKNRYEEIYSECLHRKFKISYYGSAWDDVPKELFNDYEPTERDRELIRERIAQRLKNE